VGDERKWVGGVARSHEELDEVDAQFWHDAGPAMRFIASIELAFTAWALGHPNENAPPRFAEALTAFAANVRFLVIGGHAASFHA